MLLEALVCLSVPRGNHGPEPNGVFTIVRLCVSFLCPVQETSRPKSLPLYSGTAVSLCQLRLTVRKGHKNFFWLKEMQTYYTASFSCPVFLAESMLSHWPSPALCCCVSLLCASLLCSGYRLSQDQDMTWKNRGCCHKTV